MVGFEQATPANFAVPSMLRHAAVLDAMPARCTLQNNEVSVEEMREMMLVCCLRARACACVFVCACV